MLGLYSDSGSEGIGTDVLAIRGPQLGRYTMPWSTGLFLLTQTKNGRARNDIGPLAPGQAAGLRGAEHLQGR
jgi:hypothetical protein